MSERGNAVGSSLTDMMASLMAIFVLLFVAAQNNRGAGIEANRDRLIKQLQGQLASAGIDSANIKNDPRDPNSVLIILPDSSLFPIDKDQMFESGRRIARQAIPRIAATICQKDSTFGVEQIIVEGHTDSLRKDGQSQVEGKSYNLQLSQRRAMAFVREGIDTLVAGEGPLECFLPLVSATGRGQEQPLPNFARDAKEQRRVVLRLRLGIEKVDSIRAAFVGVNP
jgi:flagellar motor protein MotB